MTIAGRRGFTLVEVLVALAIMAVLGVMAWQGVDGIVRARDIGRERLDRTLRLNAVIGQWDADLQALIDTGLQANETVVVDGQYRLQPGSRVRELHGKAAQEADLQSAVQDAIP